MLEYLVRFPRNPPTALLGQLCFDPFSTLLPLLRILVDHLSQHIVHPSNTLVGSGHTSPALLSWHDIQVAQRKAAFARPEPEAVELIKASLPNKLHGPAC